MGGDHLRLDQGHVLDEQTQDALALAGLDARIIPDLRELFGEIEDAATGFGIERSGLLFGCAAHIRRRASV